MSINDAGPMFQSSLINVIDPENWRWKDGNGLEHFDPVCTDKELELIVEGKGLRGSDRDGRDEIPYNALENSLLCRVLSRYNDGLGTMGIHLGVRQWNSPGQAAQEWFKNIDLPTREKFEEIIGAEVWDFAIESYYGGWFEIFMHGFIPGKAWEYDINSAYPSVMASLPCLLCGTWRHGYGAPADSQDGYTMVRARVKGSDPFVGAMLHRIKRGNANTRPHSTGGVYWQHELDAGRRAGLIDEVEYEEWWQYHTDCCHQPLAAVAELYETRLRVGKNSALGKALKLIYNSAYGKLTQSIGGPKFACPVYASLITAGCRIQILDAIATHPEKTKALVMVATDAVFFTSPHPTLSQSERLGEWGSTERTNLVVFKPGHYWDDKARKAIRDGGAPKFKARGVNARDFAAVLDEADNHFRHLHKVFEGMRYIGSTRSPRIKSWPALKYNCKFSVTTIGQALVRRDWDSCGKMDHDTEVGPLNSWPINKRNAREAYLDGEIIRTPPWDLAWNGKEFETVSTPYDKRFGAEHEIERELGDVLTPEGEFGALVFDSIGLGKLRGV
jgi:hypothetical protein